MFRSKIETLQPVMASSGELVLSSPSFAEPACFLCAASLRQGTQRNVARHGRG